MAVAFKRGGEREELEFSMLGHCRIIDLPKIADSRGNLTFVEVGAHIPFAIERVYYLYDVPGGAERGGHAHKECINSSSPCRAVSTSFWMTDGRRSAFISPAPITGSMSVR